MVTPRDMNVMVPTIFAMKTATKTAVGFLTFKRFCICSINVSNKGDTPIATPTRMGRTILLNIKKPAYMAKNPFHCPGSNGLKPVYSPITIKW